MYEILIENGVEVPRHTVVTRDGDHRESSCHACDVCCLLPSNQQH